MARHFQRPKVIIHVFVYIAERKQTAYSMLLVPNLGVHYPNWVMGFLIWELGFFSISVLAQIILLTIKWHWKTDSTVTLIKDY